MFLAHCSVVLQHPSEKAEQSLLHYLGNRETSCEPRNLLFDLLAKIHAMDERYKSLSEGFVFVRWTDPLRPLPHHLQPRLDPQLS